MTSKIILKKSSVAAKVPVAGDLEFGELALNYTDGKLYYKTNAGAIALLNPTSGGGGGSISPWLLKTANYTAVTLDRIVADTSGGVFTITLPAAPTTGMSVEITDGSNWATNNLTVARNGSTVEAGTDDVVLNIQGITVQFIYSGSTWQVVATLGAQGIQGPQGTVGPAGTVLGTALTTGTGIQYDAGNTFTGEFAKTVSLTQNQRKRTINFIIDGAGSIATGIKGDIAIDFSGTITNWTLLGNEVGNISVSVSKSTYATYPTFTASNGTSPYIGPSSQKNTGVIDWTGFTTVSPGDVLRFTVPTLPNSVVTRATVSLSILSS